MPACSVNDDWRARPNLTFSAGLRYEAQSNLGDLANWAPRVGLAWGLDGRANRPAKTVLRAGFGTFFDRIPLNVTLNSLRYNGANQQSFLILNPTFFPAVPAAAALAANQQPQQLRPVYQGMQAPRLYQASVGVERQLNQSSRLTLTWIRSRGVHLLNLRNTNAPIQGNYPAGDSSIRLLTESAGASRLESAGGRRECELQEAVSLRKLHAILRDGEQRGPPRRSVQFARGMGSYVLWRHTPPRRGRRQRSAAPEVQCQRVPAGEQRTALQHHHGTGSQQHGLSRGAPRAGCAMPRRPPVRRPT